MRVLIGLDRIPVMTACVEEADSCGDKLAIAEPHHRLENDHIPILRTAGGSLDPRSTTDLSWMAGISKVALVVFVRKNAPEIQYLKTSTDEQQRRELGHFSPARKRPSPNARRASR